MKSSSRVHGLQGVRKRLHDAVYDLQRGPNPDMLLERVRTALGAPDPLTHATLEGVLLATPDVAVAAAWRRFARRYPVMASDTLGFAPQVAP